MMRTASEYKIPRGDTLRISYRDYDENVRFLLTQKDSGIFYLYECLESGTLKMLGKSKNPYDLEEKHKVLENVHRGLKR